MHPESLNFSRHPTSKAVEEAAEKYVGVRWVPNGLNQYGLDCIGLVIQIGLDIGLYNRNEIEVPRYKQLPDGNAMLTIMSKYLKRVPQPMYGSVLTFAQRGTGLMHVGVIGDKYFYHANINDMRVTKLTVTPAVLENRRACFVYERPDSNTQLVEE